MEPGNGTSRQEEEVPGPEVEEFANALDTCLSPNLTVAEKRARILDLPRKYHENAIRRLTQKLPKPRQRENEDMDVDADGDEKDVIEKPPEVIQLEKEVETWDLLRRLLPLRYTDANSESMRLSPFSSSRSGQPDAVEDFILTSSVAQERRAVLQWLQTNAASGPDIDEMCRELQQNADRGDIIAHGWLHTRSKIKLRKSVTAWPHLLDKQSTSIAASHVNSGGAPLVTQLDPDAVTRQGRKLEPQDEYFERSIWLGCFEHLRRGSSLEEIRDWCQERTETWRAVSMSAMPLSLADQNEPLSNADPASLALWRRMCYALARQGGSDDYERAVYGLLSGDIASVQKVAKSWDDHLFAHYNGLLRSQIDTHMLSKCPPTVASNLTQSLPSVEAVQFHQDHFTVERHLIESLEQQKATQSEALEPHKALQAALIADKINLHLYEQGVVIAEEANQDRQSRLMPVRRGDHSAIVSKKYFNLADRTGLRIAAHTFVLIALLQRFAAQEDSVAEDAELAEWRLEQDTILAAYTEYLRLARLQELIPLYCSVLNAPRRYEVLSWNEIEEADNPSRLTQLKLIRRAGIEVVRFVETQAAMFLREMYNNNNNPPALNDKREKFTILQTGPPSARHGRAIRPDFFTEDGSDAQPTDEKVIRALEWLLTVSETWPNVFSVGTQAYKFFLKNGRLEAARLLVERVPFNEVVADLVEQDEIDVAMYDDVDFWAQQLEQGGNAGLRAELVMADARKYRELEALVKALDSIETMGSLVGLSEDMPPSRRDFWDGVAETIAATKENMQPLLGDWLMAGIAGDEELEKLREEYLPETILAYVSALHFAGTGLSRDNLLECMDLASVVAQRNSDLAAAFVDSGRMTELVEAFTACSKALAIVTGEKRATGSGSKKLREMGWSRDLWSVKQ